MFSSSATISSRTSCSRSRSKAIFSSVVSPPRSSCERAPCAGLANLAASSALATPSTSHEVGHSHRQSVRIHRLRRSGSASDQEPVTRRTVPDCRCSASVLSRSVRDACRCGAVGGCRRTVTNIERRIWLVPQQFQHGGLGQLVQAQWASSSDAIAVVLETGLCFTTSVFGLASQQAVGTTCSRCCVPLVRPRTLEPSCRQPD